MTVERLRSFFFWSPVSFSRSASEICHAISCCTVRRSLRALAELFSPELGLGVGVHELGLDVQHVSLLHDAPGQDRPRVQRESDGRRIGLQPLVAEHEAARNHPKSRELRETVDDAFGDPVGDVFDLRIRAGVDERQHGERLSSCPGSRRRPGARHSRQQAVQRDGQVVSRFETALAIALDRPRHDGPKLRRREGIERSELSARCRASGFAMISCGVAPANRRRPVSISYNTQPVAKISLRPSTRSPRTCSGDM